jgi:thiamine pyrophosphate-dependent acetolactate synthase large subunit-like protein
LTSAQFNEIFLKLAEATDTPVFYSPKMSNSVPYGHRLRGGPATRLALLPMLGKEQPDLILLLGARTGFLLGSRSGAVLPNEGCRYIQVDTDGAEIGKSHAIDVGIVSTTELARPS